MSGVCGRVDLNRLGPGRTLSWYTEKAAAEEKAEDYGSVVVTGLTVWVREGAGMDYRPLGLARKGMTLERTGTSVNGWYGVSFGGQRGYISKKYVREA